MQNQFLQKYCTVIVIQVIFCYGNLSDFKNYTCQEACEHQTSVKANQYLATCTLRVHEDLMVALISWP